MRKEVAEEIVRSWHCEGYIGAAVKRGLFESGDIPSFDLVGQETGHSWIYFKEMPTRRWLASYMSIASHALWDGRDDAAVVAILMATKSDPHARRLFDSEGQTARAARQTKIRTKFIRARALDKKHDWQTVK